MIKSPYLYTGPIRIPPNGEVTHIDGSVTKFLVPLPGYPWLDPCPRCGFRASCDCTVFERARAAHPTLLAIAKADVR